MLHLTLETVDGLCNFLFFPLQASLVVAQIAFFVSEQLINLFWEELDILHHVPEMFGMHGQIVIVFRCIVVRGDPSVVIGGIGFFIKMRKSHVLYK